MGLCCCVYFGVFHWIKVVVYFFNTRSLTPSLTSVFVQRADMKVENWARYCSGQAVREITNPEDPSEYGTTYMTEHRLPVADGSAQQPSGTPTQWHQHNILTGGANSVELHTHTHLPPLLLVCYALWDMILDSGAKNSIK